MWDYGRERDEQTDEDIKKALVDLLGVKKTNVKIAKGWN
jgi:hypothetical protein